MCLLFSVRYTFKAPETIFIMYLYLNDILRSRRALLMHYNVSEFLRVLYGLNR